MGAWGDEEVDRWLDEVRDAQRGALRQAVESSGLDAVLRRLDELWRAERDHARGAELRTLADELAAARAELLRHDLLPPAVGDRVRAGAVDLRASQERWSRR